MTRSDHRRPPVRGPAARCGTVPRALLAALVGATPSVADAESAPSSTVAGYVEAYAPVAPGEKGLDTVSIERKGGKAAVQVLAPVYVGDQVIVHGSAEMTLRLTGQGPVTVTFAGSHGSEKSPYEIPLPHEEPGFFQAIIQNIGKWLWIEPPPAPEPVQIISRGGVPMLTAPVLQGPGPRISEGTAPLYLRWQGGVPPYSIRIDGPGIGTGGAVFETAGDHYLVGGIAFTTGRYRVEIRDGGDQLVVARLAAVAKNAVPKPPAAARLEDLPPEVGAAALAGWLASLGKGEWALEGLRILAQADPPSAPTATLIRRISAGYYPKLR